jgi:hypothetical protein
MKTPEQTELDEKQTVYAALEADYTASELEYNTLAATLDAFRGRYFSVVGSLYARLDDVRARVQEELARRHATDPVARQAAQAARERAQATATEVGDAPDEQSAERAPFTPSDELKQSYRRAVNLIHPDRAENEEERQLRDRLMAQINAAYRLGDIAAINRIVEQYNEVLSAPTGDSIGEQLVRIIRLIAKTRARIAELNASITELRESEWHALMVDVVRDETTGVDPLAQLAKKLRAQILTEETRLSSLSC